MLDCLTRTLCCRRNRYDSSFYKDASDDIRHHNGTRINQPTDINRTLGLGISMPIFSSSPRQGHAINQGNGFNSPSTCRGFPSRSDRWSIIKRSDRHPYDNPLVDISSDNSSSISSLVSRIFFSDSTSLQYNPSTVISDISSDCPVDASQYRLLYSLCDGYTPSKHKANLTWDNIFNSTISSTSSHSLIRCGEPNLNFPPKKAFYINKGDLSSSCDMEPKNVIPIDENTCSSRTSIINVDRSESVIFTEAFRQWTIANDDTSADYTDYVIDSATLGSQLYREFIDGYIMADSRIIESVYNDIIRSSSDDEIYLSAVEGEDKSIIPSHTTSHVDMSAMDAITISQGKTTSSSGAYATASTSFTQSTTTCSSIHQEQPPLKPRSSTSTESSQSNGGSSQSRDSSKRKFGELDVIVESRSESIDVEGETPCVNGGTAGNGILNEESFSDVQGIFWNSLKNITDIPSYILNYNY